MTAAYKAFEERAHEHVEALTHQLRETVTEFSAQSKLTGERLSELLIDGGVNRFAPAGAEPFEVNEDTCEWMLEHAEELGVADCLVILEALGAQVDITVAMPPTSKLYTPQQQHRLAVDKLLNGVPRKLGQKSKDQ